MDRCLMYEYLMYEYLMYECLMYGCLVMFHGVSCLMV